MSELIKILSQDVLPGDTINGNTITHVDVSGIVYVELYPSKEVRTYDYNSYLEIVRNGDNQIKEYLIDQGFDINREKLLHRLSIWDIPNHDYLAVMSYLNLL